MKKRVLYFICIILFLSLFIGISALNLNSIKKNSLKVTLEHPFLITENCSNFLSSKNLKNKQDFSCNNNWISASELKVGDELITADGKKARITGIEDVVSDKPFLVYNLEDKLYHNYVLEDGLIVHNSNTRNLASLLLKYHIKNYPEIEQKIREAAENIPKSDLWNGRRFIDRRDYLNALLKKEQPDGTFNPVLSRQPELAYGEEAWQEWKAMDDFLDSQIPVLGGKIDENLLEQLISRSIIASPHPSIHYTPGSLMKPYRTSDVAPEADFDIYYPPVHRMNGVLISPEREINVYTKSHFDAYQANPYIYTERKGVLADNSVTLELLKTRYNQNPDVVVYLESEKNNLIIGDVRYPTYQETWSMMDDLFKDYNARIGSANTIYEVTSLAAEFQQKFISIHPLNDGNGRVSRLLMDYILKSKGLIPPHLRDPNIDLYVSKEEWALEVLYGMKSAAENAKLPAPLR